jgi:hypothetical protein
LQSIIQVISDTSASELSEYWGIKTSEKSKINTWINLLDNEAKTITGAQNLDLKKMISSAI